MNSLKKTMDSHSYERGFTLVEMLVALALFSIVLVIAVGSVVTLLDANRKARTQKLVTNNLSTTLEAMSRAIREGENYQISGGGRTLSFTTQSGSNVTYTLDTTNDQVLRTVDGDTVAFTAPDVTITDLTFREITFGAGPDEHPKILITLRASAGEEDVVTGSEYELQTLVSKRLRIVTAWAPIEEGSSVPNNPQCPFEAAPGRYFVNFEVTKTNPNFFRSNPDGLCTLTLGTYVPEDGSIPAGTYNITAVAFDHHCDEVVDGECIDPHNTQPYEVYRITANGWQSAAEGCSPSSGCTDDIPDDKQQMISIIAENVTFNSPITEVEPLYGYSCYGGPNPPPGSWPESVVPACAIFDAIGGPSQQQVDIDPF